MPEQKLRNRIINYMRGVPGAHGWFCTWWFKFHVSGARDTPEIRRELERMERDGLRVRPQPEQQHQVEADAASIGGDAMIALAWFAYVYCYKEPR